MSTKEASCKTWNNLVPRNWLAEDTDPISVVKSIQRKKKEAAEDAWIEYCQQECFPNSVALGILLARVDRISHAVDPHTVDDKKSQASICAEKHLKTIGYESIPVKFIDETNVFDELGLHGQIARIVREQTLFERKSHEGNDGGKKGIELWERELKVAAQLFGNPEWRAWNEARKKYLGLSEIAAEKNRRMEYWTKARDLSTAIVRATGTPLYPLISNDVKEASTWTVTSDILDKEGLHHNPSLHLVDIHALGMVPLGVRSVRHGLAKRTRDFAILVPPAQ